MSQGWQEPSVTQESGGFGSPIAMELTFQFALEGRCDTHVPSPRQAKKRLATNFRILISQSLVEGFCERLRRRFELASQSKRRPVSYVSIDVPRQPCERVDD